MAGVAWIAGGEGDGSHDDVAAPAGETGVAGGHDHGDDAHDDQDGELTPEGTDVVAIGEPMAAPLEGGVGEVTLSLSASIPSSLSVGPLTEIPLGLPVTMSLSVPPQATSAEPELTLHRRTDDGTLEPVALDRPETFLMNRSDGSLALPAGAAAHDHGAGRALTQGMPGGGFAWATSLTPDASAITIDGQGRWLASAQTDESTVELVDLMARADPVTVPLETRPEALWFSPSGSLLAGDANGALSIVDPAGATVTSTLQFSHPLVDVAFAADGTTALAVGGNTASVLQVDAATASTPVELDGDITSVTFAPAAGEHGTFAIAHQDGHVTLLRLSPDGSGATTVVDLGASSDGSTSIAAAPDGRTVVTANTSADTLTLIDAANAEVLAVVAAGDEPVEIAFLEQFALARNAGSAELTWVDLDDPTKSGNEALGSAPSTSMTVKADGSEALLAAPSESRVYLLHVMMGRPMVMSTEESPMAADTVLSSMATLRPVAGLAPHDHGDEGPETSNHGHGLTYEQDIVLTEPGVHELTVSIDGATASFESNVAALEGPAALVTPVESSLTSTVGQSVPVVFVSSADAELNRPEVVAVLQDAQGISQVRAAARHLGDGRYVAEVDLPRAGRWNVILLAETSGVTPQTSKPAQIAVEDPQS